ncbi:undecaprenyl-phosphate glucose phosphotransferase [Paraburkholderia sp. BL25I1N1]|uniref:undecaprenyl-phosphate glucose phosphotransferase n=1 Tax=Paraburkholderia sp. BL25I1N1 TaxID=1938804 RepID=UPI000D07EDED|nr:undecaprenyl-phosphate glucose phosphotransferase [Paraburkholderia sp. BL25I1N1]
MIGIRSIVARILDGLVVVIGAIVASDVRLDSNALERPDFMLVSFVTMFTLVAFPAFQIYVSWRGRSSIAMISQVCFAWISVQAASLVLLFMMHRTDHVSRLWFAYWTSLTGIGLIGIRTTAYLLLGRVRYAGLNLRKVAVVGSGEHARYVIEQLAQSPASGFRAVALYTPEQCFLSSAVSTFADVDAFATFVRAEDIPELWLALPLAEALTIQAVLKTFGDDLVNIRLMPDMGSIGLIGGAVTDLIGMPTINLMASPLSNAAMLKKALFDRLFSAFVLTVLAPVLLVIAIMVKLSSPGPVIFTQLRKGADGRVFRIYKFRTMRLHDEQAGALRQATRGDARITRVGLFLRRMSLDELPQFFNVLRGDMSVVGPRPHAIEHDNHYKPLVDGYIHRYRIKPGITGWAQINGFRGETDHIDKMIGRVQHDLFYLRNWSFWLDMRIVAATVVKSFVHPNAY